MGSWTSSLADTKAETDCIIGDDGKEDYYGDLMLVL